MKRFTCNYCEFSTEYKPNLNRHYKRKHSTEVASASPGAPSSQPQPHTLDSQLTNMSSQEVTMEKISCPPESSGGFENEIIRRCAELNKRVSECLLQEVTMEKISHPPESSRGFENEIIRGCAELNKRVSEWLCKLYNLNQHFKTHNIHAPTQDQPHTLVDSSNPMTLLTPPNQHINIPPNPTPPQLMHFDDQATWKSLSEVVQEPNKVFIGPHKYTKRSSPLPQCCERSLLPIQETLTTLLQMVNFNESVGWNNMELLHMLYKRKINANKYMELYEEYAREKLWDHLEQLDAKTLVYVDKDAGRNHAIILRRLFVEKFFNKIE